MTPRPYKHVPSFLEDQRPAPRYQLPGDEVTAKRVAWLLVMLAATAVGGVWLVYLVSQ